MPLIAQPKLSGIAEMVERRRALWRTLDERSIAHYQRCPVEKELFDAVLVRRAAIDPEYAVTLYRDWSLGSKGYPRLQAALQEQGLCNGDGAVPYAAGYFVTR